MRSSKQYSRWLAAAAIMVLGAFAEAGIISATFNNIQPAEFVQASVDGGINWERLTAGRLNWTRTGGDYPGAQGEFSTFCIEIPEFLNSGDNYTFDVVPTADAPSTVPGGMGLLKADLMAELFGRHYGSLDLNNVDQMMAMQVAVWEIVYDDGLDLSGGDFRVDNDGPFHAVASSFLSSLDGQGPRVPLVAMYNVGVQDQIVPEPASVVLLLGGIGFMLRRRGA